MTAYTIVNATSAEFTNVNAAGEDVPKYSIKTTITLTAAELATAVALTGCVVVKDALTRTQLRVLARGLKYLNSSAI